MPGMRKNMQVLVSILLLGISHVESSIEQCKQDSWGIAGNMATGKKPFAHNILAGKQCEMKYEDAKSIPGLTMIYYPNSAAFHAYRGVDMVPMKHAELVGRWAKNVKNWVPGQNGPHAQKTHMRRGSCEIPQPDGGGIHVQRLGPFTSTGNYDWWQVGWHDVWHMSKVLASRPEGVFFTVSFSGAVKTEGNMMGTPLGFPPIHVHHIHISPTPALKSKFQLNGVFYPNFAVEQHGDYQCIQADGGNDCLFEETVPGFAKTIDVPLDLEGELNDVRAPGSTPMEWWYQVVLRWHPRSTQLKPLSQLFWQGPGVDNPADQLATLRVFPVRTDQPSMYWYSGRMPESGQMVRNKLHSHNTAFDRAFWFAATPSQLGLNDPKFVMKDGCRPKLFSEVGFQNVDQAVGFIFKNLAASEKACKHNFMQGRLCPHAPALICQSRSSSVPVMDPKSRRSFMYDRRAPACCRAWHFQMNQVFTVVAFMRRPDTPPGPWEPDGNPPTLPMHIHWVMTHTSSQSRSGYTMVLTKMDPDRSELYGHAAHSPIKAYTKYLHRAAPSIFAANLNESASLMQKSSRFIGPSSNWQFDVTTLCSIVGMLAVGVGAACSQTVARLTRDPFRVARAKCVVTPPPCCPSLCSKLAQGRTAAHVE